MNDGDLLAFGCAVTFIALAGAYVYVREAAMVSEHRSEPEARPAEADQQAGTVI